MSRRPFRLLVLLAVLAAAIGLWWTRTASRQTRRAGPSDEQVIARFLDLETREREVEHTVWSKEMLAQECGRVFESLWDSLNETTNKLRVLASFPVDEVLTGKFTSPEKIAHDIEVHSPSETAQAWTKPEWEHFLEASATA